MGELDIKSIARSFEQDITEKAAEFAEIQLKNFAQQAASRSKKVISRSGKSYRYRNTGELAKAINILKQGDKLIVNDGTRGNYSDGYHGMYFLVEKKGISNVNKTLKDLKSYTESLKL